MPDQRQAQHRGHQQPSIPIDLICSPFPSFDCLTAMPTAVHLFRLWCLSVLGRLILSEPRNVLSAEALLATTRVKPHRSSRTYKSERERLFYLTWRVMSFRRASGTGGADHYSQVGAVSVVLCPVIVGLTSPVLPGRETRSLATCACLHHDAKPPRAVAEQGS